MHASPTAYAQAFIGAQKGKPEKEKDVIFSRLVTTMWANDDEKKIPATLRAILRLLAAEEGGSMARMVTGVKPTAQEKTALEKQFCAKTYEWEVNPEILGGLVVEQGTRLYQMSLRHLLKGFER